MTSVREVIHDCRQRGIRLFPNGNNLRVVPAPNKPLPSELLATLKAHKQAVMAALAHEDSREYVAERMAICAADDLPPCGIRPVFEYHLLTDDPRLPLIMLGRVGESLADAERSLRDRYAGRLLDVHPYVWPPKPARLQ
ncbi:hypothetical protein [Ferrovum sp.]|uniref:TubC N-terminal docking domain-related protein n=1 Tax=Ferrovum sp. TaxID=2609467 RepID=UPI002633D90D|nr:hypothetical protein [Ferrovum sp.]